MATSAGIANHVDYTTHPGKMTVMQKAALGFGIGFILIGILGFIPGLSAVSNATGMHYLLGLFMVGTVHNIVHLASGVAALLCSRKVVASAWYLRLFGIVYFAVTVLGFTFHTVLGLFDVNVWDNILHVLIAAIALGFGFIARPQATHVTDASALGTSQDHGLGI